MTAFADLPDEIRRHALMGMETGLFSDEFLARLDLGEAEQMAEHCRRLALESIEESALLDDPTPEQEWIALGGVGMNVASANVLFIHCQKAMGRPVDYSDLPFPMTDEDWESSDNE